LVGISTQGFLLACQGLTPLSQTPSPAFALKDGKGSNLHVGFKETRKQIKETEDTIDNTQYGCLTNTLQ
jgi:hypothetical protein